MTRRCELLILGLGLAAFVVLGTAAIAFTVYFVAVTAVEISRPPFGPPQPPPLK